MRANHTSAVRAVQPGTTAISLLLCRKSGQSGRSAGSHIRNLPTGTRFRHRIPPCTARRNWSQNCIQFGLDLCPISPLAGGFCPA